MPINNPLIQTFRPLIRFVMGFKTFIKQPFAYTVILLIIITSLPSCVPRCTKYPIYAQCKVRMRHVHSGKEYRGVPIYKKQNMQYGEKHKGAKDTPYVTPKVKKPLFKKKKKVLAKPDKKKP